LEMLPFIQCHQVCGFAAAGGSSKPRARSICAQPLEAKIARPNIHPEIAVGSLMAVRVSG